MTLPRICCPATFFTPILAAFNRAEADHRDCTACDALFSMKTPITQFQTRQSLRAEHSIQDAPITDCLAAVFCTPCAVAQDSIEIERRAAMNQASTGDASTVTVSVPMMDVPVPAYAPATSDYSKVPEQCQV